MKPSADSFGTFLQTMQRLEDSPRQGASIRGAPVNLLGYLANSGVEPVMTFMKASGLGVVEFASALSTLQDAGLVIVKGAADAQTVELTPMGAKLADQKP